MTTMKEHACTLLAKSKRQCLHEQLSVKPGRTLDEALYCEGDLGSYTVVTVKQEW